MDAEWNRHFYSLFSDYLPSSISVSPEVAIRRLDATSDAKNTIGRFIDTLTPDAALFLLSTFDNMISAPFIGLVNDDLPAGMGGKSPDDIRRESLADLETFLARLRDSRVGYRPSDTLATISYLSSDWDRKRYLFPSLGKWDNPAGE